MLRTLLLSIPLIGCGARAPAPSASPAPSADPAPSAVAEPPAAAPVPAEPVPIPEFAALDVDLAATFPLGATIRVAGAEYETADGAALAPGDRRPVLRPVIALEPHADGSPRRPRLLCDSPDYRVAVHMDAADLAVTASLTAIVSPAWPPPAEPTDTTPGLRLVGGTEIELVGSPEADRARIRYEGMFIRSQGWVDARLPDVVYRRDPSWFASAPTAFDAELRRNVEVRAEPSKTAAVVASIEKRREVSNQLFVRKLGKPRRGYHLIRYREHEAEVIGWVETSALRSFPLEEFGPWSEGGGSGSGGVRAPRVQAVRGSLLVGKTSGQVMGVVTAETSLECESGCDGDEPIVRVYGCLAEISVRLGKPRRWPESKTAE